MTNRKRVKQVLVLGGAALLGLSLLVIGSARAQDAPPPPSEPTASAQAGVDNPGVARVSFIRGDVSMQRGDSGEASDATLNTPLEAGDKIMTGADSRTELELDAADILRLDQNAQANIATLGNNRIQVQVGQGLASYSVMKDGSADVEIDTPNVAVHPLKEGRYRVQVDPNGDTEVIVRDGQAEVSTPQGSTQARKGDLITIRGAGNDAQYKVTAASSADDFDNWNKDRDGIIYNARAWDHTNRNYTGAGDLDSYGVWDEVPDYGSVWVPAVDAGWAPYRAGRWAYEPYWGWTWVSSEPWGWAPYHYGRWFMYGNRWAWWPGPVYGGYRPIWAPAYVSFFGFGGGVGVNFGFGVGFGSIGWLPIGPCDYFHPWWGGYRDRFAVVGFNQFRDDHNGFRPLHGGDRFSNVRDLAGNDRLRAGISGVGAGNFGRGTMAPHSVSAEEFRGARAMTGNVPVVPGRDSLRTSNRPVNASLAARGNQQEHFFSRMTPAARPESFSQASARTQEALQRNNIQFHGNAEANAGGGNAGRSVNANPSYRPPAQRSFEGQAQQQSGTRQSAQPSDRPQEGGRSQIYQGSTPRSYEGQGQSQSGWRRFSPSSGADPAARAGGNQGSSYRPPLNMNKPIVTERAPRENGGYSEPNRGYASESGGRGYSNAPTYRPSAPRPSAPSPSYRSQPSQPSYRGGGGSSGASRSAPSYRGGGSSGGSRGGGGSRGSSGRSSGPRR